jgi:hypothetical protein
MLNPPSLVIALSVSMLQEISLDRTSFSTRPLSAAALRSLTQLPEREARFATALSQLLSRLRTVNVRVDQTPLIWHASAVIAIHNSHPRLFLSLTANAHTSITSLLQLERLMETQPIPPILTTQSGKILQQTLVELQTQLRLTPQLIKRNPLTQPLTRQLRLTQLQTPPPIRQPIQLNPT